MGTWCLLHRLQPQQFHYSDIVMWYLCVVCMSQTVRPTLRASLSGTFLQGRKDVVKQCLESELVPQYLKSSLLCLCV